MQVWETDTGALLDTIRNTKRSCSLALSPDGQLLATYAGGLRISVVSERSGFRWHHYAESYGSHCGKFLATAETYRIGVWDVIARLRHSRFECSYTTAIDFVPDYGIIATASGRDIILWRWPSGIKLRVLQFGWKTNQLYPCPASLRLRTDRGTMSLGTGNRSVGSKDLQATSLTYPFMGKR
jgi:WD40 repeat protein